MVWPALLPPWKRTTISARLASQSTTLPLPSSPHWAPITATLAIRLLRIPTAGPHRRTGCACNPGGALQSDHPRRSAPQSSHIPPREAETPAPDRHRPGHKHEDAVVETAPP